MKFGSLFLVEIRRLFRDRLTWLTLALTALAPAAGFHLYRAIPSASANAYTTSVNGTYLGNPALAGALFGAVIFGLLTVIEFDRVHRFGMDSLTDALVSPLRAGFVRTMALMLATVIAQVIVLVVWLPHTVIKTDSIFQPGLYAAVYLLVMLPAMWFGVLFSAAVYQITRRLDLTLVLFAAFVLLSMRVWSENWLLHWVNPALNYLSDDFGNTRHLFSLAWNRLFWLLLLGGGWVLSFLCVRRYGKGIIGSFIKNLRKFWILMMAFVLLAAGGWSYKAQPFIDHSCLEIDDSLYDIDYCDAVTYAAIQVNLYPDLVTGCQHGTAVYKMKNSSGQSQTVSFRVNPGYSFSSVKANGTQVMYRDMGDDNQNGKCMEVDLPADTDIEMVIEYGGFPQEWNILAMYQGNMEISQDYIYLANQSLSPIPWNFVQSTESPSPYTAAISLPAGMIPVLFGTGSAAKGEADADGTVQWNIDGDGGSQILYAGDYVSHHIVAAGINVEFLYSAKHQRVMEECKVDDVLKSVFDYCTAHYGALQFYGEDGMKLIEIGAVGGGYAGDGASVMGEDSFIEEGLKDPLKGAGGSEVLAHEIIHQWWGLGNMFDFDDASGMWSSEGLTVYTTYRMMKEQYGAEYAQTNYVDVWQAHVDDYYKNFYVRHPEYLNVLPEQYRTEIENSLSQVRQYCEMPLKILRAEQLVGGEQAMDEILYELFNRELDYSYPYLTYQDFLDACGLTEEDLNRA